MDRDAQKARFPTGSEDIGDLATRVIYHFHCRKSLHLPALGDDEQSCIAFHDRARKVARLHERVELTGCLGMRLDGGPEVWHEVSRNGVDHVRESPR